MKVKKPLATLLACMMISAPLAVSSASTGILSLDNEVLERLEHHGPAHLKTVKVKTQTIINGPLNANNLELRHLELNGPLSGRKLSLQQGIIRGPIELSQSKVTGVLTVHGPIDATDSRFSEIIIYTDQARFKSSAVHNLTVAKENRAIPKVQQVLLDNSQITGTLVFESGRGEVILTGNKSHVGEVVGGRLIRHSK